MKERFLRSALRILEAIPLHLRAALFETFMLGVWALDSRHRRIGRINLGIAFPGMEEREASRILRTCYMRVGTSAAEFIHFPKMDPTYVAKHFRIEGAEHVTRATEDGGLGPLALTGHFGNWELLSFVYGALVEPVAFIVRPLKDPGLDRIVTERREMNGNRVIRKEDSAKLVIREVRNKTMVGIAIDQNVEPRKGVPVDFFGRKAYTPSGIARLALALGTKVVPAFIFRDPRRKFHHTLRFGPPIPMDPGAPREEEVLRLTRRCNEELEKAIRQDPALWLWFTRRWKDRPPGEPDLYGDRR